MVAKAPLRHPVSMNNITIWNEYLTLELPKVAALLIPYGITLDKNQPHTMGERFLMQALTTIGGRKLILLGVDTTSGKKVVIKASNDSTGKLELEHERTCRTLLHSMKFSYETFHSPEELYFIKASGYTIFVSEYIEQASSFLNRPLTEQFSFALRALKAQERTRATTAGHLTQTKSVFGTRNSADYVRMFEAFMSAVTSKKIDAAIIATLGRALETLNKNTTRIDQYSNFLTHTDFVPHNFRIKDDILYLLDFSSLRFGNKHESWARFLNFMTLYNPELESLLLAYVEHNRAPEERDSLHLMRLFRLGEIITYYANTLEKSSNNLLALNNERIHFWNEVLQAELQNQRVALGVVEQYKTRRDYLRSEDEKARQIGLH